MTMSFESFKKIMNTAVDISTFNVLLKGERNDMSYFSRMSYEGLDIPAVAIGFIRNPIDR